MGAVVSRPLRGPLRQCFTRHGKPKRRFASRAEAREFNRRQRSSLHAYQCADGHWHLGGSR